MDKAGRIKNTLPRYEIIEGVKRPVAVSDFWPKWHSKSKKLLGTGHTVVYTPDWRVTNPRPRNTSYSVYNIKKGKWQDWQKLKMPDDDKFYNSGAGCVQRYDLDDGSILLPSLFAQKEKTQGSLFVNVLLMERNEIFNSWNRTRTK